METSGASTPRAPDGAREGNLLGRFVAFNVLGSAISTAIGLGASVALARWLGPADRGLLALMYSVSGIALLLGGIGVPWAAVYFASKREVAQAELFGNSLVHAAVLAAVLIPAAALLHQPLSDAFGRGRGGDTWVLAGVLVPITFLNWTTHGQLQGMLLFGRYNVLSVLSKAGEALCIVLLLGALGLGVTAGMVAYCLGSAVMVGGAIKPILAGRRPQLSARLMKRALGYGARVQVGSIFQTVIARLDLIILQAFVSLTHVGFYAVAQIITEVVLQVTGAFQSTVMPLVSRFAKNRTQQSDTSADAVRHHCIVAGAATAGVAVLGPIIIYFLYGSRYEAAIAPMLVLLPATWFAGMGGVIQGDLSGRGTPGVASGLSGLAAAITIVLDLALIPLLGVMGAALASLVSYTFYGVASLVVLHRVTELPIRRFVVPTRADLAAYRHVARRAIAGRVGRREGRA